VSTELHERRAGFQAALNAALLAGNPTAKLRVQIADIDRQLAEIAQAKVAAVTAAQQAAEERIEAAGQATASASNARLETVMADLDIPVEQPMIPDAAIDDAARELARCEAELASANAVMATAQAHHARITSQITGLQQERQAIVSRRTGGGDQLPSDGAKLAELAADIEGLGFMVPEAKAGLNEARVAVTERSAARQQAVTDLGRAEKAALAVAARNRNVANAQ
jgi:chromosome segregation ATPase